MIQLLVLLLAAAPQAPRRCQSPDAEERVRVRFPAGTTVEELAAFAAATECKPWSAAPGVAARPLKLVIDGEVTGRQVRQLITLLAEGTGVSISDRFELVEAAAEPTTASTESPGCAALGASIVATDPWTRLVPRENLEGLRRCAEGASRVVPAFKEGKCVGFKLFGIRPGSVVEQLGFANGDLLSAVNGEPLVSSEQALALYATSRVVSDFRFAITRHGEPRTISWKLR